MVVPFRSITMITYAGNAYVKEDPQAPRQPIWF